MTNKNELQEAINKLKNLTRLGDDGFDNVEEKKNGEYALWREIEEIIEEYELKKAQEWQDISTAPDEALVINASGNIFHASKFNKGRWYALDPRWQDDGSLLGEDPTHWMALPAPPKKDG